MLTTSIHADLTKYRPKIAGGLTARTLACIALALATAVLIAAWAWFALGVGTDSIGIVVFVAVIPFWAIGFLEPEGMKFERWLPLWLRHNFGDDELVYGNGARYEAAGLTGMPAAAREGHEISRAYRKFRLTRGFERWPDA